MILAAGRGERLRPVTDTTPKAMVEVQGQPMIDRHLRMLADAGASRVVINLGWLGEKIADYVGSGRRYGVPVVYSPEYEQILETGGGIKRALPMLGDAPFWVINADIYTDWKPPVKNMTDDALAELTLITRPQRKENGDFSLQDGKVQNDQPRSFTFAGIARYRPAFFDTAPTGRFSVVPMMREFADRGRLAGSIHTGEWEDIGTVERLNELNSH